MTTTTLTLDDGWLLRAAAAFDWLFAVLVLAGGLLRLRALCRRDGRLREGDPARRRAGRDLARLVLGPLRVLMLVVARPLLAIACACAADAYGADLAQADQVFLLKYFLSSQ